MTRSGGNPYGQASQTIRPSPESLSSQVQLAAGAPFSSNDQLNDALTDVHVAGGEVGSA